MKIFQFFINPGLKEDVVFDCFCFEPENFYERKLGALHVVGYIKSPSFKNHQLLRETANFLKNNFYKKMGLKQEEAFRETLRETNSFLEQKIKKENPSWLGGLSFAILNLKDFKMIFTKAGKINIHLIRGQKLYDLDKKIKTGKIEHYPFRVFGKMASGRLLKDDIVMVGNKELFDFFKKEKILKEVEKMFPFEEKKFRELIEERKEKLNDISGICFFLCLSEDSKEIKERIELKEEFSLKENFEFFLKRMEKIKTNLRESFGAILSNKKWRLILIFLFFLLTAFFIFQVGENLFI